MTHDIVINGRFLSRRITGVERYGQEIVQLFSNSYRVEKTRLNGAAGHTWEQFVLPTKLTSKSVLWSPANTGPLMVRRQALTIHDLTPLEHPEWFSKSFAAWYRLFLPILARRVQVVFTPSEYVKQKVQKQLGVKSVIVTPNGVDTAIFHPEAFQKTYEFPKKYILFVGSLQPRKNLTGLMEAWHAIKDDFKDIWLVIAGEAGYVFRGVKFFGDERIRFMNYASEVDLPGLYAQAEMLVLPSFDEGFGLPAIEAMACGTPVIASDGGALPETVGEAGLIFELSKPNTLARAMQECLSNANLRLALKEKGLARAKLFSWQHTADLVWKKLNEI
ncbi:MAG: glycosyltransferase family 1 protein [Chloroflexota bacterium]